MSYLNKKSAAKTVKTALRTSVSYAAMSCMLVQPVFAAGALPSGGQVIAGDVAITAPSASEVLVTQSSGKGIVNWTDFSIGQGNSVQFNNGSGATLNRVTGPTVSSIDGRLSATGSVFLINANGVIVGSSGVINTGGSFVASTLDTLDADFLDGGDTTFKGASKAAILNYGKVGSLGGDVALIAAKVDNEGSLEAQNGTAALAAGYEVLMRDATLADGKFVVKVGGSDTEARNTGAIKAADAELRANDGNVYALSGNLGGFIRADGVSATDGHVFLTAEGGNVTVDSTVAAKKADGTGGLIVATGDNVALKSGAKLVADGTKGGTVLVGGDQAGGHVASRKLVGFDVANASTVTVEAGASVSANGSEAEGGNIVFWSDDHTDYRGSLSTLGAGSLGGFAEVSSEGALDFNGSAQTGETGMLLLDPRNMTIVSGNANNGTTSTQSVSQIGATAVATLLAGNNVTISAGSGSNGDGDITVNAAVNWSSNNSLTLNAYDDIAINQAITNTTSATAGLNLIADGNITDSTGGGNNGQIKIANLDIQNHSATGASVDVTLDSAANAITTLTAGTSANRVGAINVTNSKSLAAGTIYSSDDVTLTAAGSTSDITATGTLNTTGDVSLTAGRSISLANVLTADDVSLFANNSISQTAGSISTDTLSVARQTTGNAPSVALNQATNFVNGFAAGSSNARVGAVSLTNAKSVALNGVYSTGAVNVTTAGTVSDITISDALDTSGTAVNLTAGRNIAVNDALTVSSGTATLTAGTGGNNSSITDGNNGSISASKLALLGGSKVTATIDRLSNGDNAYTNVGTLAANVGTLAFNNGSGLTVGTVGTTNGITATGDVSLNLTDNGDALVFNQALITAGNLAIQANGAVTQSAAGIITASGLSFDNWDTDDTDVSVTLTGDNKVSSIRAGSNSTSGRLGNINFTNLQSLTVDGNGVHSNGTVTLYAKGTGSNLTLASGGANDGVRTSRSSNGTAITIAADGNFINNAGSNGLTTGDSDARWLVYAGSSTGNTYGSLNSGNQAVWGTAYASSVSASGNRYVFVNDTAVTTLAVTYNPASLTKVYGSVAAPAVTAATLDTTAHVAVANAYSGDTGSQTTLNSGQRSNIVVNSTGKVATANVGLYDVVATYAGYTATNANALSVTQKSLTIKANDDSKTYDGLAYNGGNGVSYTGFVNDETSSVLGGALAYGGTAQGAKNAGGYTITASGLTSGNYAIAFTGGALTVNKASLTVKANDDSKTYNGLAYNGGNGVSYAGFVNDETSSVLGGTLVYGGTAQGAKNAGAYTITASGKTSGNYDITYTVGSLNVGKAQLTVTADNKSKTYGDNNPNLSVTYTGFVHGENKNVIDTGATLTTDATKNSDVGNYGITAANAADNNYSFVYVNGTLKVNKATLLVTADSGSKTYGDDNPTDLGASYFGFKLGQDASVLNTAATTTTSVTKTSNAGIYATNASGASANNYSFVYIPGVFLVNKAVLTVTADDKSKIYGDANPALSATYTGFVLDQNASVIDHKATLTTTAKTNSNVGNYTIYALLALDNNYTFSYKTGTMAVTPATLTIAANEQTKVYGQDDPTLGYNVSGYKLGQGSSVLSGGLDRSEGQNVGNYGIDQGTLAANSNYTIAFTGNTLHITPATLTVAANGQTKVYGDLDPTLGYSVDGYQYSDDSSVFTGGLDRNEGRNVGNYAINLGTLAAGGNYTIAYTGNTLSITPRSITVTADNLAKLIGDLDPALTWKITDGNLVYDDNITGSLTRDGGELPGDYAITQGDVAANSNYTLTFVNGALTINPLTQSAGPNVIPGNDSETPAGETPQGGQAGNGPDGGETTGSIDDKCDTDGECVNKPYPTNTNPGTGIQFVSN